jgi:hypothetical protein
LGVIPGAGWAFAAGMSATVKASASAAAPARHGRAIFIAHLIGGVGLSGVLLFPTRKNGERLRAILKKNAKENLAGW